MKLNSAVKFLSITLVALLFITEHALGASLPKKEKVVALLEKANDHWQQQHPNPGNAFWDQAAYQTGNMEAYKLTRKEAYLSYALAWAEHNQWKGAKSNRKETWKYARYGEKDDYVLFGDWQVCFQTYADLYWIKPEGRRIARAREVMEYQMQTPQNDYWWWSDGLYMVMPVMTKMYNLTGNPQYLSKLHDYWSYACSIMYDEETGLFFRDAKYVYPKHKTTGGKKDFWARGDGWVFAALAKVIEDLPDNHEYRSEYIAYFSKMAKAVKDCQQPDGYWTRSLLDPAHAPGPETSGTAFFTYGLLWGMNHGILDREEYEETALRAWNYLQNTALQEDGSVGYVQPIGEKAIPGQQVDARSTANFGVGAFLLAACEMARYVDHK